MFTCRNTLNVIYKMVSCKKSIKINNAKMESTNDNVCKLTKVFARYQHSMGS